MRTRGLLGTICIALVFAASSVPAQENRKPETKTTDSASAGGEEQDKGLSGTLEIGAGIKTGDRESAKFEEDRDIPNGAFSNADLRYKKDATIVKVKGQNIGRQDQNLEVEATQAGSHRLTVSLDDTPHRFAYDASTPYYGVGTGNLLLSDTEKQSLILPNATSNGQARAKDFGNRMLLFMAAVPATTDLELKREKGTVKLDVMALDPVNMMVSWSRENRTGTRPIGGAFGQGWTIELPEPINYTTSEGRLNAEYVSNHLYASGGYFASRFTNNISTLVWDNPISRTDNRTSPSFGSPTSNSFTLGGPAKGRMDLPPDSLYQTITGNLQLRNLPLKTQANFNASLGTMRQNDHLLPYTSNTAIAFGDGMGNTFDAYSPLSLPRQTAQAGARTSLYEGRLTSEPLHDLSVRLKYRVNEYENTTKKWAAPGKVVADSGSWNTTVQENEPLSFEKQTGTVDAKYKLFGKTSLGAGYTNEVVTREEREVARMEENAVRAGIDSKFGEVLDVRLSGMHSHRAGDYEWYVPYEGNILGTPRILSGIFNGWDGTAAGAASISGVTGQNPMLRKYDEANRKRDEGTVATTLTPNDDTSFSASALYGRDVFPDSKYGLTGDYHTSYSIDADMAAAGLFPKDWETMRTLHVHGFYTREIFHASQRGRQWSSVTGIGTPYFGLETLPWSTSDWEAETKDLTNTYGAGFQVALLEKKLDLDVTFSQAVANGTINYSSPIGDPASFLGGVTATTQAGLADNNNFYPLNQEKVNDTKYQVLKAKLTYKWDEAMSVVCGHHWERFVYDDYNSYGFQNVPVTSAGFINGGIFMGGLPKGYVANYTYASFSYRF